MRTLKNEMIYFSEHGNWGIRLNENGAIPDCVFLFDDSYYKKFFWFNDNDEEFPVIIDKDSMICEVDLNV